MIDFDLSEEHRAVEQAVREWAAGEVAPRIHDLDREHRFERGFLKGMADLHLLGICVPEAYGGAGLDYISLGLVSEELEYVDTHLRVIMSVHVGLNSMTLMCWGTEQQKKKYLVPQARGAKIATYGLTEPNAGSDAVGIQSTAVRKGDRYVLNGEKVWISLADVADHFLVIAWTDQEKKKARDHSASPPSSWSVPSRASARTPSRRSGASWPATRAASPWTTWRSRSRTGRPPRSSPRPRPRWRTGTTSRRP